MDIRSLGSNLFFVVSSEQLLHRLDNILSSLGGICLDFLRDLGVIRWSTAGLRNLRLIF